MGTFFGSVCTHARLLGSVLILLTGACNRQSPVSLSPSTVGTIFIIGPNVVMSGSITKYSVTAALTNQTSIIDATPVTWISDNASVATVSADGLLTANRPGTASITATYEGKHATTLVRVPTHREAPDAAQLVITFEPDPITGSMTPCGGSFWGRQVPTWSDIEIIREARGVGFTLKMLTYNFFNQNGALTLTMSFPDNHYFPPYDEHVEDGCMALAGSPSGLFEEILEGVDDHGNQLTFVKQVRLLPVAR